MTFAASAPIESRREFQEAVRLALASLPEANCQHIWLCDPDFVHWPLNETVVIESLSAWASPRRRVTLLARSFSEVVSTHPRWVGWRKRRAHCVDCLQVNETDAVGLRTMLVVPGWGRIRLFDSLKFRGSVSYDPADVLSSAQALDAISQRSSDSFPATTLGL